MNYGEFFSEDVGAFMRSPVREIFKKVDLASIYSFAGGYPDASTFPLDEVRSLSARVLEKYGAKALQYGATQGVTELREVIAKRYGVPVENVQITTSSQQGIDVCTRVFANPGDVILTTSPTYLGALQSFKSYRADVRTLEEVRGILPPATVATHGLVNGRGPSVSLGGMSAQREVIRGQRVSGAERADYCAVGFERLQGAEIGRRRGQDDIARIHEHARADIDALLRRGRDLDVLHRDAIALRDYLAKLRHTLRRPVLERLGAILLQHLRTDAADILQRERGRVGIAPGKRIDGREIHFLEDLAHRRAHEGRNVRGKEFIVLHRQGRSDKRQ